MKQQLKWLSILAGPMAFCACYMIPVDSQIAAMAGIAIWMAIWWFTECLPLAVTALLPILLYPLTGIMSAKEVAPTYTNHIIFLFLGGFIMAFAIERWNLHQRIAYKVICSVGNSYVRLLLGMMLASFFLSMWISNTATTLVLLPTCLALIKEVRNQIQTTVKFEIGLLLGIAYAASIGGTASVIGTAPNLVLLGLLPDDTISFGQWMAICFPPAFLFLLCTFGYLAKRFNVDFSGLSPTFFHEKHHALGRMSYEERTVAILFALMGVLWFTRVDLVLGSFTIPGWSQLLPHASLVNDSTIAIFFSILLFLIPSKDRSTNLMDWQTCRKIPFDIILLFGGGFALAKGFGASGLSTTIGEQLTSLTTINLVLVIAIVVAGMTFLTELTSNTATSQLILPILASVGISMKVDPIVLMMPAALAASYAFMLPVATPPNAIVFGAQFFTIKDMARTGFVINLIGIAILVGYFSLFQT